MLVADAGAGHFLPIFRLAKHLKQQGYRVVVCSFEQRQDDVQAAGIGFVSAGSFTTSWDSIPNSRLRVRGIVEVPHSLLRHGQLTVFAMPHRGSPKVAAGSPLGQL